MNAVIYGTVIKFWYNLKLSLDLKLFFLYEFQVMLT